MQGYSFKLARADEHLDAFYRATDGWGDGDPLAIDRESNADGSEHVFRLRFKAQPDLWQWAVLLGDAMHNLRCALDYIGLRPRRRSNWEGPARWISTSHLPHLR